MVQQTTSLCTTVTQQDSGPLSLLNSSNFEKLGFTFSRIWFPETRKNELDFGNELFYAYQLLIACPKIGDLRTLIKKVLYLQSCFNYIYLLSLFLCERNI